MNKDKHLADETFEVGKFYRVPCIQIKSPNLYVGKVGDWIPVLLPAHPDPELSFAQPHYHIDYRFARVFLGPKDMATVISPDWCSEPVEKRRKCRREQPLFPQAAVSIAFRAFETTYLDKKIDTKTLICPHKGICLKGIAPVDGVITCPGHGLKWNTTTGACIPHHTADTKETKE